MKFKSGEKITTIQLPATNETIFNTESLKGKKYLLSFYRFGGCPFCNIRIHNLIKEFDNTINMVAVFESPIDDLIRHLEKHNATFPILSDEQNIYYKKFGIEHSLSGMLKGMIFRFPTLMKSMFKGNIPTTIKGNILKLPADFLIDENGIIHTAYYAKDEGDHLPTEQIKAFFN